MTKNDLTLILNKISVLKNQPLRMINRAGSIVKAYFGDCVESEVWVFDADKKLRRDDSGNLIKEKGMLPRYAIHAECTSRLTCDDKIIFAKSDIFLPAQKIASSEGFSFEEFEWDEIGNNYFDEMSAGLINEKSPDFIVKDITITKYGDLTIFFTNGFTLEFFADGSSGSENWRFFENSNLESHLVITGDGIEET